MAHTAEVDPATLLEYLSSTLLVFDTDFRLRYINPAGEMMFSHSKRHACGRHIDELFADAGRVCSLLANAHETGQAVNQRGCRIELANGKELVVNCTHTPISLPGGVEGVMLELRKVDHHLRVDQEEQLIAQQEASRALLRGLAHEIKNPLGGLRGAAQLLQQEINDESLRDYTRIIIGEADRLHGLIDRMLGPNDVPNMRDVNIHEILQRVRELVLAEAESGLRIRQDYDPSLPELRADPDLMVQAILNIVRNAAQALAGNGTIRLRTRVLRKFNIGNRQHRLVASIEIIDNGPGIDPALQARMFYPMVTSRSDGTGLGLSIAQSLINRHHGLIECSSKPGKTVFTILLPLEHEK
jgi:two-component system nitrogen regulation sensor histidine kinase GlnL